MFHIVDSMAKGLKFFFNISPASNFENKAHALVSKIGENNRYAKIMLPI